MTSERFISWRQFRYAARRTARELLICVVLPSALMVSVEVVAQKTAQSQQQRSDEQIAVDINNRLTASTLLHPLNLGVWVHDGTVTLSGVVPSTDVRQQAEAFMKAVPGVKSVDDQLTIGTPAAQANAQMPPPADQGPGDDNDGNMAPDNQGPQDQGPGQAPPPPSNPYGQPPASAQNSPPPQGYQGANHLPMVTIPAGTPLTVMMLQGVNSRHTQVGTRFHAVLVRDVVLLDGIVALPRGSYVDGVVIDSRPPGHLKGHPKLALQLTKVDIGDASYPLSSYVWARRGPGKGGQTTGNVIGGAAVGGIVGGAVGGGPTALLGAVLGGFGGAGLSALSSGARLVVPPESVLMFYLNAPVTVREPTMDEMRSLDGNVPATGYGQGPGPNGPGYPPPPQQPPPGGPPGGYPY